MKPVTIETDDVLYYKMYLHMLDATYSNDGGDRRGDRVDKVRNMRSD